MRGVGRFFGLVAVALGYASCRQLVGVVEREEGTTSPAGDAGDATTSDAGACASCQLTQCGKETADCEANAECQQSFACLDACAAGDETCSATCIKGFGALHAELLACRARSCAVPCKISCGGIFGTAFPALAGEGPNCTSCVTQEACSELSACAKSANCVQHVAVLQRTCPFLDRSCWTAILFALGNIPESQALADALGSRCTSECRKGSNWDCVGKVSWPAEKYSKAEFHTRVMQAKDPTQPFEGALVQACYTTDKLCAPSAELDSDTSDANGYIHLTVPISATGFAGYMKITGAALVDYIAVFQPPLSGSLFGDEKYTPYPANGAFEKTFFNLAKLTLVDPPLDDNRGYVLAYMADCTASAGTGVTFEVTPSDSATRVAYFASNVVSPQATKTDRLGLAIIYNVPPAASFGLTARRADTNEVIGKANAFLLPNTITNVIMAPLPKQ